LRLAIEILAGRYELQERDLLSRCLADGDVVLELGTGIGLMATLCARRLGSDRVFTFEANPEMIAVAEETFRLNGVAPKVENCALGAAQGAVTFFVEEHFWSSSTIKRTATARTISVPVRPLAEAIREIRPTILIVDIEGGEATLFDGVALDGVQKIMIELHPHVIGAAQTERIRGLLRGAGFAAVHERSRGTNVLFERVAGNRAPPTA
jgi:FkbM family methyltransferase